MKIGRLTISDRASAGIYADRSGPEIENVLREFLGGGAVFESLIVPDEVEAISAALRKFADALKCDMVVTTGGTGPSARDVTPEATKAVIEKELPGFGEITRTRSHPTVPTAILSRATAGVRGKSLIVNLPGKPSAVSECLPLLLPAIVECIDHISGFRPELRR